MITLDDILAFEPFNPFASIHAATTWKTPYRVVLDTDAYRLLAFRECAGGSLLVIPPQAGHHSYIADYKEDQSLIQAALEHTAKRVYAIEWKSCTYARRLEGITDLLSQVDACVQEMRGDTHLVGLCQGGWLATIYAALNPERVHSLTIAGAPIDTHAGESVLEGAIHRVPMWAYRQVVAMSGGLMRGDLMLANWKSFNPMTHFVERYHTPKDGTEEFYAWYDRTQHIAGAWYLWCIEHLFKGNKLYRNQLTLNGRQVDLGQIDCPVHVVCGDKDDITPPEQSLGLLDHCTGRAWIIQDTGHIGVFMSRSGIREVWSQLFREL